MTDTTSRPHVGALLRSWRERRRLSQLELSSRVEVSTRHLSCVETGKSRPSPQLILRLTRHLNVPLRERNEVLLAAGYAPAFPQHRLDAPALARVSDALRLVLDHHQPYPAVVLNRWWELVDANAALTRLIDGVSPALLEPPVNVLRLSLHPDGLAPRITNLGQWRAHLLSQLQRRIEHTGDQRLRSLLAELLTFPDGGDVGTPSPHDVVLPLMLRVGGQTLSMFTIEASLGTAADVTIDELVVESFYPADDATDHFLQAID